MLNDQVTKLSFIYFAAINLIINMSAPNTKKDSLIQFNFMEIGFRYSLILLILLIDIK